MPADIELPPLPTGLPTYEFPGGAYSGGDMQDYGLACYARGRADLIAEIHKRVTDRAVAGALLVKDVRNIIPKE